MTCFSQSLFVLLALCSTLTLGMTQEIRAGFLITVEGDTVAGLIQTVKWPNEPDRISHFVVAQPDGSKKEWQAKTVAQYTLGRDGEHYFAKVWPHNGLRVFLQPRQEGKTQLFIVPDPEVLRKRQGDANRVVFDISAQEPRQEAYYLSSPDTELAIRVTRENYDLVLKQVLKDCPELTEQIGKKKFRFNNLERIISYYNESCP